MPYADGRLRPDETFVNDRHGGRIYVDVHQTTHSRLFPEGDFNDAMVRGAEARAKFNSGQFNQITKEDSGARSSGEESTRARSAVDHAVARDGHGKMMERFAERQVPLHQQSLRDAHRNKILQGIARSAGDFGTVDTLKAPPRSRVATATEQEVRQATAGPRW